MASVIPPSLKLVTAAIRRAEELENDPSPEAKVVSYFCRLYAVSKASKLCSPPGPAEGSFLMAQMDILEKLKSAGLDTDHDRAYQTCKDYAMTVFNKADEVDRAGLADKAIAKVYYAAGTFFDILEQFGDIDNEIAERRKYAKWKTTDILNSIKLGLKPTSGGFGSTDMAGTTAGEESDGDVSEVTSPSSAGIGHIPAAPQTAPEGGPQLGLPAAPFQCEAPSYISHYAPTPQQSSASAPTVTTAPPPGGYMMHYPATQPTYNGPPMINSDPRVVDAIELCHFAIAGLKKNDLNYGREKLKEALSRLG